MCPANRTSSAPDLDQQTARRLAIGGAGLAAIRPRQVGSADVLGVLEHLGALQLDTISTLARAHELVPAARLGHLDRGLIDAALWGAGSEIAHPGPVHTVEYWSHAACILPVTKWPAYAFRRREFVRRGKRWQWTTEQAIERVRAQLRAGEPITTSDIGGAKTSGAWWSWSDTKVAIEWLLDIGEVVCVRRVGWRRVYDATERALPAEVLDGPQWTESDGVYGPADDACHDELVESAALTLGVATIADLADMQRLKQTATRDAVRRLIEHGRLEQVNVEGWGAPAFVHTAARAAGTRRRAVLLSPFDPLVWERSRTERLFGLRYRLESYTPASKRERGYYAMPVLAGDRIVGTVDPARIDKGRTLQARTVTLEATTPAAQRRDAHSVATALAEAASWVGADRLEVSEVRPPQARDVVVQAVSAMSSRMSP